MNYYCFLALILITGTMQICGSQGSNQATPEGHVKQIIETLPQQSEIRLQLERGERGDGVHHNWMDLMREEGVKWARIEVEFTWRRRPEEMKIVREIYFKDYYPDCAQIIASEAIQKIESSGLAESLRQVALERTSAAPWRRVDSPSTVEGARGVSYVELLDDEWLSAPILLQQIDPKRSSLEQSALRGDQIGIDESIRLQPVGTTELNEALFAAALSDNSCTIETLLKMGASVNARGETSSTPLLVAAGSGRLASVRTLLKAGADVNAKDNYGRTAMSLAESGQYLDIVRLLEQPLANK